MNSKLIGEIVQAVGIVAVIAGVAAGAHHLGFSIPVALGAVAYIVGKKISAGSIAV